VRGRTRTRLSPGRRRAVGRSGCPRQTPQPSARRAHQHPATTDGSGRSPGTPVRSRARAPAGPPRVGGGTGSPSTGVTTAAVGRTPRDDRAVHCRSDGPSHDEGDRSAEHRPSGRAAARTRPIATGGSSRPRRGRVPAAARGHPRATGTWPVPR
jgi:hypothetical protein